jgi:hypothetical protein
MCGGLEIEGEEETREEMTAGEEGVTTIAGIGAGGSEEGGGAGERHRLCLVLLALIKPWLKGSPHFSQCRCRQRQNNGQSETEANRM